MVCYDMLWIKVQHNGVGITNEEQQYIFEPFFTHTPGKAEDYDAGKRLSFSHFIITEQHQGQLAVTSDLNVGTTFHLQLPLT
jgi:signal transduction histidine kinase